MEETTTEQRWASGDAEGCLVATDSLGASECDRELGAGEQGRDKDFTTTLHQSACVFLFLLDGVKQTERSEQSVDHQPEGQEACS